MALGKRQEEKQQELFVATTNMPKSQVAGSPVLQAGQRAAEGGGLRRVDRETV